MCFVREEKLEPSIKKSSSPIDRSYNSETDVHYVK